GVDVTQADTVVSGTDVGSAITVAQLGDRKGVGWGDAASHLTNYGYNQTVSSTTTGKRFNRSSGPTPATISNLSAATTVTAGYGAQWLVTFAATGLGGVAVTQADTVVSGTDVGSAITVAQLGTANAQRWFDAASNLTNYGYNQTVSSTTTGKRFNRSSGPTPATISNLSAATTVTAGYDTQYKVSFDQSGIGSDTASNNVVTIAGAPTAAGSLPDFRWVTDGQTISFAYQSPVATSPASDKRYVVRKSTHLTTRHHINASAVTF